METELLFTATASGLEAAAIRASELLAAGQPVALPTETVYGLAADALRPEAAAKIFEAKERPFFDPLICHLPTLDWLDRLTKIPDESRPLVDALTRRFWPGPLTLVLPRQPLAPDLVTAGLDTVAVRMSAHLVFQKVSQRFGRPLAAPSANRFGRISPTAAAHVLAELSGRIPLVLDGGPTQHGVESTIVAVEGGQARLLRAGPITPEDLATAWKESRDAAGRPATGEELSDFLANLRRQPAQTPTGAAVEAPGNLASHYAPRTPMRLLSREADFDATKPMASRVGFLAFRHVPAAGLFVVAEVLSPAGDLREAAAGLFAKLRRLDEAGVDLIIAEPVPAEGLGIAIMDRLLKASARTHPI